MILGAFFAKSMEHGLIAVELGFVKDAWIVGWLS